MAKEKPTIRALARDFAPKGGNRGLDKYTQLAISKFEQRERLQRRADELEVELNIVLVNVPDGDMGEYIERTQAILDTQYEKLEAFRKKWDTRYESFLH